MTYSPWRPMLAVSGLALTACMGCDDGGPRIHPLDPSWSFESAAACRLRPPASDGTSLFVPFADGVVRSFDLATGALRWAKTIGGSSHDDIALFDGHLIVQTGLGLIALDPASGQTQWTFVDTADGARGTLSFNASTGAVLVGGQWSKLRALNMATGTPYWTTDLAGAPRSTVISSGLVIAGSIKARQDTSADVGRVFGVSIDSGSIRWEFVAPASGSSSGIVAPLSGADSNLVANAADGQVYVLNGGTGRLIASFDGNVFLGGSVTDGRTAYVPSSDGHLYAINVLTGTQLWSAYFGGASLYTEPVILGDSLVLVKVGNALEAIYRHSGRSAWRYTIGYNNICAGPLVVGKWIVLDAEDGIHVLTLTS